MNKQLILTQAKRELWENKVGFVYAPLIVTAVLLLIMAIALIKINSAIEVDGIHFNVHFNNHSISDKKTFCRLSKKRFQNGFWQPLSCISRIIFTLY